MVLCTFFQRGRCKFGDKCSNEHPGVQTAYQSPNRFAPLQNQSSGGGVRSRSGGFGGGNDSRQEFNVTVENIQQDLHPITDRPIWPFSAYGPGLNAPRQLLEGKFEQSPQELRLEYYKAKASGIEAQYQQQEAAALADVQSAIQNISNNTEAAKKYVLDGQNEHPNRLDQVIQPRQPFPWIEKPRLGQVSGPASGFGAAPSGGGGGAFGQPPASAPIGPRAAFGAPSSMGQGAAFGQSSALGGNSAFGKASPMGAGASTFGQASSIGTNSTLGGAPKTASFGQSTFGQPAQPAAAFGQPSQPASTFGQASQPTAFGQPSQPAAFGQPSQPGAFGQASQPAAFGQASKPASGFGQPSPFGAAALPQQTAAFDQPSRLGAFGSPQPVQNGGSAFGQTSTFMGPKTSPFAAAAATQSQQPQGSTPFMKPGSTFGGGFGSQSAQTTSAFGQASTAGTNTGFASAPSVAATQTPQQPTLTQFRGRRIEKDKHGQPAIRAPAPSEQDRNRTSLQRVWFTNGPPSGNPDDTEALPEVYMGELGKALEEAYAYVREQGVFKDNLMPEVPPKRQWVHFDL